MHHASAMTAAAWPRQSAAPAFHFAKRLASLAGIVALTCALRVLAATRICSCFFSPLFHALRFLGGLRKARRMCISADAVRPLWRHSSEGEGARVDTSALLYRAPLIDRCGRRKLNGIESACVTETETHELYISDTIGGLCAV